MKEQRLQLTSTQDQESPPPKVGMIMLSTDLTCEADFCHLKQTTIAQGKDFFDFYINRIEFYNPLTKANLAAMLPEISSVVSMILPGENLDAVVFNCTSASALLGDKVITDAIKDVQRDTIVLTTASASVQYIIANNCRKISLLTPYNLEVSRSLKEYFQINGLEIISLSYLDMNDDRDIGHLQADQILEAAIAATAPEADALFISCTATPAVKLLTTIGAAISKPCFSSNHSTFMQTLRAVCPTTRLM